MLLVSALHSVWDPERKKTSKKFGRLVQARADGLTRMVWDHRTEVQRFIHQKAGLAPDSPSGGPSGGGAEYGRRVSTRTRASGNGDLLGASLLQDAQDALVANLYRDAPMSMAVDKVEDDF